MDTHKAFIAARVLVESGYSIVLAASEERGAALAINLGRRVSLPELTDLLETCERLGVATRVDGHNSVVRIAVTDYEEPEPAVAPSGEQLAAALTGVDR